MATVVSPTSPAHCGVGGTRKPSTARADRISSDHTVALGHQRRVHLGGPGTDRRFAVGRPGDGNRIRWVRTDLRRHVGVRVGNTFGNRVHELRVVLAQLRADRDGVRTGSPQGSDTHPRHVCTRMGHLHRLHVHRLDGRGVAWCSSCSSSSSSTFITLAIAFWARASRARVGARSRAPSAFSPRSQRSTAHSHSSRMRTSRRTVVPV